MGIINVHYTCMVINLITEQFLKGWLLHPLHHREISKWKVFHVQFDLFWPTTTSPWTAFVSILQLSWQIAVHISQRKIAGEIAKLMERFFTVCFAHLKNWTSCCQNVLNLQAKLSRLQGLLSAFLGASLFNICLIWFQLQLVEEIQKHRRGAKLFTPRILLSKIRVDVQFSSALTFHLELESALLLRGWEKVLAQWQQCGRGVVTTCGGAEWICAATGGYLIHSSPGVWPLTSKGSVDVNSVNPEKA